MFRVSHRLPAARLVVNQVRFYTSFYECFKKVFLQARNLSRRLGVVIPQRGILLLQPQNVAPQARFIHTSRLLFSEIIEVHGPAFAESISEGDIRWIKQKGDYVKEDELVAEIGIYYF